MGRRGQDAEGLETSVLRCHQLDQPVTLELEDSYIKSKTEASALLLPEKRSRLLENSTGKFSGKSRHWTQDAEGQSLRTVRKTCGAMFECSDVPRPDAAPPTWLLTEQQLASSAFFS